MSAPAPSSILIIGGGVFGLSTAYALSRREKYSKTKITLLDRSPAVPPSHLSTTASVDTTRIIRADYADPAYAALAGEAQALWRTESWGGQGRYSQSGLCLVAAPGREDYVQKSFQNVLSLQGSVEDHDSIRALPDRDAIAGAMHAGSAARGTGESGYWNPHSGWADAEACIRWLWSEVKSAGRVHFVAGEATRLVLSPTSQRVTGALLTTGESLVADVTILATGAWTGQFVDLRGVASARGQCIGYMDLSSDEARALAKLPVHYNMSNGMYLFPPSNGRNEIKVAMHAYGYSNPVQIPAPLGCAATEIITSLPAFPTNGIPNIDKNNLTGFMLEALPVLSKGRSEPRKLSRSRLCWYLDTHSSDFLICPYPLSRSATVGSATNSDSNLPSLFLATGGSGHGFKFLPVLGERVVDVLDGTDVLENGATWTKKWAWPGADGSMRTGAAGLDKNIQDNTSPDEVWCMDGSRSGPIGMTLEQAFRTKSKL